MGVQASRSDTHLKIQRLVEFKHEDKVLQKRIERHQGELKTPNATSPRAISHQMEAAGPTFFSRSASAGFSRTSSSSSFASAGLTRTMSDPSSSETTQRKLKRMERQQDANNPAVSRDVARQTGSPIKGIAESKEAKYARAGFTKWSTLGI